MPTNYSSLAAAANTAFALFGPTLLLISIAVALPYDAMIRWPVLLDCVQTASNIIPAMVDYIKNSAIPEVAAVFLGIAWLTFPIHVVLLVTAFNRKGAYSRIAAAVSNTGRFSMEKTILKTLAVALLCGYGLLFLPNDPSFIGQLGMNSSRVGLAVFGSGCFFGLSLSAALFVYLSIGRMGFLKNTLTVAINDFVWRKKA